MPNFFYFWIEIANFKKRGFIFSDFEIITLYKRGNIVCLNIQAFKNPNTSVMEVFTFFAAVAVLFAVCKFIENYLRSFYIENSPHRWVLITGCDTGFGHRLAQDLDKRGARVFAGCLTEEGEKRLGEKCSDNVVIFRLDVTRKDSIQNAVNLVRSRLAEKEGKKIIYFISCVILWKSNRFVHKSDKINWYVLLQLLKVIFISSKDIFEVKIIASELLLKPESAQAIDIFPKTLLIWNW